jgi:conjugative transposon TraN protein
MKCYHLIAAMLGGVSLNLQAQPSIQFSTLSFIVPYDLQVTFNKTTNLLFPDAVASIDKGSSDILVQRAFGAENIVRIKADKKWFEETNLSVITKDGQLYSFLVTYSERPSYLNVRIATDTTTISNRPTGNSERGTISGQLSAPNLKSFSQQSLSQQRNLNGLRKQFAGISVALTGVYVKDNTMFYRIRIENHSNIDYGIEQFKMYIRDKRQAYRTARQEIEIRQLYILGDTSGLKGNATGDLVMAVPKFTIPDGKYVAIEILEHNGGRNVTLKMKNRHIIKAQRL